MKEEAILAAQLICESAEICGDKSSVELHGLTVYKPYPELLEGAQLVLDANAQGQGLDEAIERFGEILSK